MKMLNKLLFNALKTKKLHITLLLTLTLTLITITTATATTGTMHLYTNTTLTEDHYGEIVISDHKLTLDGNGYSIFGDNFGVSALGQDQITIKNCNIDASYNGITILGCPRANIINNKIRSGSNAGILIVASHSATIENNEITNAGEHGLSMEYCYYATIKRNTVTGPLNGFYLNMIRFSTVEKNTAEKCSLGFGLYYSDHNIFIKNRAYENVGRFGIGLLVESSVSNVFEKNKLLGNSRYDIHARNVFSYNEWIKNKYDTILE